MAFWARLRAHLYQAVGLLALLFAAGCGASASSTLAATLPVPTATPSGPYFSPITFALDVTDDGMMIGEAQAFPAGTKTIWAFFNHVNMQPGQSWGRLWKKGSEVFVDSSQESWSEDYSDGWMSYSLKNSPALSGDYSLVLYLDGVPVQESHFTVPPLPDPTPDLNPPRFDSVQFASAVTDASQPVQVLEAYNPGVTMLYGVFKFQHLQDGTPWKCEWLLGDEMAAEVELMWEEGNTGTSFCSYNYQDGTPVDPGEYTMNLYIDGQLAASGATRVLDAAVGSGSGIVMDTGVDAALMPIWNLLLHSPDPLVQQAVGWAVEKRFEVRLGETPGTIAAFDCRVGGSGKVFVSAKQSRTRSWEESAAAIAREVTRAKDFATRGSCRCSLEAEANALQAQVNLLQASNRLDKLDALWQPTLDKAGIINRVTFNALMQKKDLTCR